MLAGFDALDVIAVVAESLELLGTREDSLVERDGTKTFHPLLRTSTVAMVNHEDPNVFDEAPRTHTAK